jgi:sporulation protein YlmC with PRC-barrel domain
MRQNLLTVFAIGATCFTLGAQAQNPSGSSSESPGSSSSKWYNKALSATGFTAHQELRGSQLTGAQVMDSSGQTLGTINDVIINPTSGKIDFAVLSLSSSGGTSPTGSATGTSGGATGSYGSSTSTTGGKLVPVPWALLRPSSASGGSSAAGTTGGAMGQQQSFTFAGDSSKLQAAPSFSQANWPDISQPTWRHSVFSYYGMSAGSATGGAESPGGSSGGTYENK